MHQIVFDIAKGEDFRSHGGYGAPCDIEGKFASLFDASINHHTKVDDGLND